MNADSIALLANIADALNTTIEHVWVILMQQVKTEIISNIINLGFFSLVLYKMKKWLTTVKNNTSYDEDLFALLAIAVTVVGAILLVLILVTINETITLIFNPEYWGLSKIVNSWNS